MSDDSGSEDLLSEAGHDERIHVEPSLEHVLEARELFGALVDDRERGTSASCLYCPAERGSETAHLDLDHDDPEDILPV